MPKDRVLFVCTDGARSLIAGSILAKYGSDRFEPCCVATKPRATDHRTVQVLRQHEVDSAKVWLYPLASVRGEFAYVFVLDKAVKLPDWLGVGARDWEMPDPLAGDTLASFEQTRDLIEATLFDWLTQFEEQEETAGLPAHHLGARSPAPSACQGLPPRPA